MNTVRSMFAGAALLALPAEAQEHRFEDDPVVMVRENFVACDVLSQLQRVMDNPRFLLSGECDPVRAGDRVRRPHPEGLAVGRGDARLHRVRAREMGRAGQQLGLEGSQ